MQVHTLGPRPRPTTSVCAVSETEFVDHRYGVFGKQSTSVEPSDRTRVLHYVFIVFQSGKLALRKTAGSFVC